MGKKRKPSPQVCKRNYSARCLICQLAPGPDALHAHRVVPGSEGGKYSHKTVACLCPTCHTQVHLGQMSLAGPFLSTRGWGFLLIKDGRESFLLDVPAE